MKRMWNYIIAALLCGGGTCAYYFNPYRKGSLVVGFILQLFCSILIFANISENETTTADFRSIAKETKEQNIYWLVGSLFVAGSAAAIVLNGVEFGIFRFGLLVIMWGGLFMLSKYIGYFSWRSRNKETVQQLAAEGIAQRKAEREKTKQEEQAEQQSVQKAKEQQEALALNVKQLEDAFNAQVANTVKTRQRVQESPDLFILSQLSNGDEAGLQEALKSRLFSRWRRLRRRLCSAPVIRSRSFIVSAGRLLQHRKRWMRRRACCFTSPEVIDCWKIRLFRNI